MLWIIRLNIGKGIQGYYYCETEEIANQILAEEKQKASGKWWVDCWEKVGPVEFSSV